MLLWLTNYRISRKVIFTLLPFIIIPACLFIVRQINTAEPETFLIPSGYQGKIRIILSQKCGQPTKYEGKRRLYVIPDDGILMTQFEAEQGFINHEFYIIENGKRRKVEELMVQAFNEEWTLEKNQSEPPRNKVAIFEAGRTYSDGSSEFYICTYNQFREYGVNYDQTFDSLTTVKKNTLKKNCD